MNIIIVGGGKIGTTILENLVKEGHNVVAVDSDPKVTEMLSNQYDVMCVCGNGVDNETLSEAGVEKAQLLIAVTGSDEFNMLCCFLAKKMGAENTVARIRKPEYNDQSLGFMKHSLDISMVINPDSLAAKELFNLLQLPGAESVETFSRKNFEMVQLVLKPDSVFITAFKKFSSIPFFSACDLIISLKSGKTSVFVLNEVTLVISGSFTPSVFASVSSFFIAAFNASEKAFSLLPKVLSSTVNWRSI